MNDREECALCLARFKSFISVGLSVSFNFTNFICKYTRLAIADMLGDS